MHFIEPSYHGRHLSAEQPPFTEHDLHWLAVAAFIDRRERKFKDAAILSLGHEGLLDRWRQRVTNRPFEVKPVENSFQLAHNQVLRAYLLAGALADSEQAISPDAALAETGQLYAVKNTGYAEQPYMTALQNLGSLERLRDLALQAAIVQTLVKA